MTNPDRPLDLDVVIEEIRAAVEANTAAGIYPADLEDELSSHYARLLDRADGRDRFDHLRRSLDELSRRHRFSRERIDTSSDVPGGSYVHRVAGKVVSRQVLGLTQQLNEFVDALAAVLQSLTELVEEPRNHTHDDILHELDTVQDRLAAVERSLQRIEGTVSQLDALLPRLLAYTSADDALAARVERLEAIEQRREQPFAYSSLALDAISRGSPQHVSAEYAELADQLVGVPGPVLDIGAGRGELLELLSERAVKAWGVELDKELVADASQRGIDMRLQDGFDALRAETPGSLGAVVLLHVIEHLDKRDLPELLSLCRSRLAQGGKLVLETPNPQSLYVYARAFYLDPTHSQPVHPVYLEFLLRQVGFDSIECFWTAPPSNDEALIEVPGDDPVAAAINENVRRVNSLLFAPQNFRMIATR